MSFWTHLSNNVVAIVLLVPLVVAYWRGSFELLDLYFFPDFPYLAGTLEIILGVCGGLLFQCTQKWMGKVTSPIRSPIAALVVRRWYSYFFAGFVVCVWRGTWLLWDLTTGTNFLSASVCFAVGIIPLLLTRCYRNALAPPLSAASDLTETFFEIPTRFRVAPTRTLLHFLDNLFSVGVIVPLITCLWRGLWYILDHLLLPYGRSDSYWLSTGGGLVAAVITMLLQSPAAAVSRSLERKNHKVLMILFEDLYMSIGIFAGIDLWRGLWGFGDLYLFPSDRMTSAWICHLTGFGGLMLTFHSNSAVMKGFQYDGEHTDGNGCWFPAKCLSVFDHYWPNNHGIPPASTSIVIPAILTPRDLAPLDPCELDKLKPEGEHADHHNQKNNSDIKWVPVFADTRNRMDFLEL